MIRDSKRLSHIYGYLAECAYEKIKWHAQDMVEMLETSDLTFKQRNDYLERFMFEINKHQKEADYFTDMARIYRDWR